MVLSSADFSFFPLPTPPGGPSELPGGEVLPLVDTVSALPRELARGRAVYQVWAGCLPCPHTRQPQRLPVPTGDWAEIWLYATPGCLQLLIRLVLDQQTDGSHGDVGWGSGFS